MNDAGLLLGVMDATKVVAVAGWVWAVLGAIALIGSVVWTALIYRDEMMNWSAVSGWDIPSGLTLIIALGTSGSGLLTMGISAAGLPAAGIWFWRGSSALIVLLEIILGVRAFWFVRKWSAGGRPLIARGAAVATPLVAGLLAYLAFQAKTVTIGAALAAAAPVGSPASTATMWSTRIFWQNVTLGTLAFGTICLILLFVERIQRGSVPQIETHWGGIGGGLARRVAYLRLAGLSDRRKRFGHSLQRLFDPH